MLSLHLCASTVYRSFVVVGVPVVVTVQGSELALAMVATLGYIARMW